ncbi:MAG: glycosyltransferase [Flavisolibacter sp.]
MTTVLSIVSYKFLPAKTGGQRGIALFNKYFSAYVDLTALTVKENENSLANYKTIPFFSTSPLRYINPAQYFRIRKLIKNIRPDHLLIEHPYFGWLGVLLKKSTGVKMIVHSHNIEGNRFKTVGKWWWNILSAYEKWTHRNADHSFFVTQSDLDYAVQEFRLDPSKCLVVTYGTEQSNNPTHEEVISAKELVRSENNISKDETILFFNGSFNYKPNADALEMIANTICPLLDKTDLKYKIIVCGPWLKEMNVQHPKLILKGFVDQIEPYFIGADIFINPVTDGGGIKTKLVEALSFNSNAVSTISGATGVDPDLCNGKLLLARDDDWPGFVEQIITASKISNIMKENFYTHFYWGYNTKRAAEFISLIKS